MTNHMTPSKLKKVLFILFPIIGVTQSFNSDPYYRATHGVLPGRPRVAARPSQGLAGRKLSKMQRECESCRLLRGGLGGNAICVPL